MRCLQRLIFIYFFFCVSFAGLQIFSKSTCAHASDRPSSEIVRTENLEIHFSPKGAVPILWHLIDASSSSTPPLASAGGDKKDKISLFGPNGLVQETGEFLHIQLFPLNSAVDDRFNGVMYRVSRADKKKYISIQFESPVSKSGMQIIKTYKVPRRGFGVEFTLTINNTNDSVLFFEKEQRGLGILLGPALWAVQEMGEGNLHGPVSFVYKTPENIQDIRLGKKRGTLVFPDDEPPIEWAGFNSRYFLFCLMPKAIQTEYHPARNGKYPINPRVANVKITNASPPNFPYIEMIEGPFSIGPGKSKEISYIIFGGPKSRKILLASSYGLEKILFHNLWFWFRALCLGLMALLGWLYSIFSNWGLAIIVLSILMRTITFPVTRYGIKQQNIFKAQQAKLKPLIDEINKKYKDDADKSYHETMRLYRENGVSPFASFKGCIWLLVQLPIFIGLFQILSQFYEIRGEGFLWIRDLSQPEMLFPLGVTLPLIGGYFNLLPVLMGVVQLIQSYIMNQGVGNNTDNQHRGNKWIYILPVTMMILFYSFASGLLLYWTVTNVCQIFEQWMVAKQAKSPV